jgi:hypothetical protein
MESLDPTGFGVFTHPVQQYGLTDTAKAHQDNAFRRHPSPHTFDCDAH